MRWRCAFCWRGDIYLSKSASGHAVPSGSVLTQILLEKTEASKTYPLEQISAYYQKKFGSMCLHTLLKELFVVGSVDRRLAQLYKLPWLRIYTTNYDDAIEYSRASSRGKSSFSLDVSPKSIPEGAAVHINGFIHDITPQNISERLKLTDYSYALRSIEDRPEWVSRFLVDLRTSRHILFIGYSLSDIDIARLLVSQKGLKAKVSFIISADADEVEISMLEPYGEVLNIGIERVFDVLNTLPVTGAKTRPAIFYSLEEFRVEALPDASPLTTKVHEQLIYGTIHLNDILSGRKIAESLSLCVERGEVKKCVEDIASGSLRDVAIVGGIASGKTFAALQAGRALLDAGFRVFWIKDSRHIERDLNLLAGFDEKICVIVDGYGRYLDLLRPYLQQRGPLHVLIATERAATHELVWPLLRPYLSTAYVPEIDLDTLTEAEAEGVDELINFAGLWTDELAGKTKGKRVRHIRENLNGSFYKILLEVLRSKKVISEIDQLFAPWEHDDDARRFFATAFIVGALGANFWINDWQIFYKLRNIRELIRKYQEHLGHFIQFDLASIRPRTSVASLHMLSRMNDDSLVATAIADVFEVACRGEQGDGELRLLKQDLIKYSVVEPLFSERQKFEKIVAYYLEIRTVNDTYNNPDYWLQLGIACTIFSDFEQAGIAFTNAYAREKSRPKPNTIRIDNYFARFQLNKAAAASDAKEAFGLFQDGATLLLKQIFRDDNKHYPFKAGEALMGIATRHADKWDPASRARFVEMCATLASKGRDWERKKGSSHRDVALLIREADKIVQKLRA